MVDVCFVVFPTQLYTTTSALEVLRGCNRVCVVEDPHYYKTSKALSIGFSMACESYVAWLKTRGIMAGFINVGKIKNIGGKALDYFTGTKHQIWMWELENDYVYDVHPTTYTFAGVGIRWLKSPRYTTTYKRPEIETALYSIFKTKLTTVCDAPAPVTLTPTINKKIAARIGRMYNDGCPAAPVYIEPGDALLWLKSILSVYKSNDINRVGFVFRTGQKTYIQILDELPWIPKRLLQDVVGCMYAEALYHNARDLPVVTGATPAMPLYTLILQRAMCGLHIDSVTINDAIAYGVVGGMAAADIAEFFKKTPWWSSAHAYYATTYLNLDRKIDNTYSVLLDLHRRKQTISLAQHSSVVPSTCKVPVVQQVQSGQ
jgi:hypothetical protein